MDETHINTNTHTHTELFSSYIIDFGIFFKMDEKREVTSECVEKV